ncbi:clathrin heavy chain linker domain-containing protein 1 isoform X2 [Pseudophryne corroboree]|uniref:clathrin heavy chain linker domain-containing protein 1 isoform X2 n=1 Tax=Pseudophryne corroboree TaxID=495146 RepID=UPI0030817E07
MAQRARWHSQVIEYCTDYKGLLTSIKKEYDTFIDAIKQGETDATHLRAKLKTLASEPTTLVYHRKRAAELADRIDIINKDSIRIESQLQKLLDEERAKTPPVEETGPPLKPINPSALIPGDSGNGCLPWLMTPLHNPQGPSQHQYYDAHIATRSVVERTFGVLKSHFRCLDWSSGTLLYQPPKVVMIVQTCCILHNIALGQDNYAEEGIAAVVEEAEPTRVRANRNMRRGDVIRNEIIWLYFSGMTREDSLNIEALIKHQQHLEDRRQTLNADMKTKYVPIQRKQELDIKLSLAVQEKEEAESVNRALMDSYKKKRVIADTILSWSRSDKSVTLYETLGQMMAKEHEIKDDTASSSAFDDLDPSKVLEAESLLEYVERFNELFVSGQYKAAAVSAAHSPRGILRNTETMERFKAVVVTNDEIHPLLWFFEALMETSTAAKHPVNAALTLEGAKCALSYDHIELVVHWVTQQRITFSEALGDVIRDYGEKEPHHKATCLALGQLIYRKCSSLRKAALCMCLQGQIQGAIGYTYQSKRFLLDDYLFLLKECPTAELINGLTKEWNDKPAALSVGQAMLSLLCTDHKEYGFQMLENIYKCGETLEQVILNDVVCTPEGWVEIAEECSNNNYRTMSEKIMSIVISQDGVVEISSKDEDAKIMDHVFM